MKRQLVGALQNRLAKSRLGTGLAIKIREQCNTVIGLRCKSGIEAEHNGEAWLADRIAPAAQIVVDVGANMGDWTTMFAQRMRKPGRAVLFEPNPEAAERLEQLTFANPRLQVDVLRKAAGDTTGTATFFAEVGCGETSSLVQSHSLTSARTLQVPVTTLDIEMATFGLDRIDMLKIDAEGFDLRVLQGAAGLLRGQRVGVVQFEYNAPWAAAGSTLLHAFQFLEGMGYSVFLLKTGGLYRLDPAQTGEYFRYSNFVALHPDRLGDVLDGTDPCPVL